MDALRRAIILRQPPPGLIHHSDRGSQYCSADYHRIVSDNDFIASSCRRASSTRRAAVRQLSIADITFSWPRLICPRLARRVVQGASSPRRGAIVAEDIRDLQHWL